MEEKKLFDENNYAFDAIKATQHLSTSTTIEKYDYKLQNNDYASVDLSKTQFNHKKWIKINLQMSTCLNKLNNDNNFLIKSSDLTNCLKKFDHACEILGGKY